MLMGVCLGFTRVLVGNYLFRYLHELGATSLVFGAAVAVSQLAEIPYLWYSAPLQRLIGRHMSVLLSMVCFLACVIAYSFLRQPWLFIPFEFLKGLSFGALWSSAIAWVHARSPRHIRHYARRIFVFVYSGIGGVLGSVVGGILYELAGPRSLWLLCSGLIVLAAISWAVTERKFFCKRGYTSYEQVRDENFNDLLVGGKRGERGVLLLNHVFVITKGFFDAILELSF